MLLPFHEVYAVRTQNGQPAGFSQVTRTGAAVLLPYLEHHDDGWDCSESQVTSRSVV